jgi:RHS repeat-associated protein
VSGAVGLPSSNQPHTSTNTPTVTFKYTYDEVGNLTHTDELIANNLTATTIYKYQDPRYLNTEIIQTGTGLTTKDIKFKYNTTGDNDKIERYVDGILTLTTTNTYDTHGRLKDITQRNSTGIIAQSTYGLDNLNRLISTTKNGQTQTYDYDSTDQVKTVTGSNSEAYTYDQNGNRTNSGYVTDAGNRLRADGTYNYEYDFEGNRTLRTKISDGTVDTYSWDYCNRLMGIVTKDLDGLVTRTVGYTYDVGDRRVSKTIDGVVEHYYLDGEQIAFVTDGGGNETFHYLYGLNVDQVLAQDSFAINYQLSTINYSGMLWALADRLGSVDTLTDADGVVVDERTFDSFGRLLSQSNPSVSFRYGYTGRELDLESGLDYYRARYYDAAVGRFVSVDPMGFGAGDTNLYRYVGNNSTNATDPSGMWSLQKAWNGAQQAWNNGVRNVQQTFNNTTQTVQDLAYNGLVSADRFVAGLGSFATGGNSDRWREYGYGDRIAGQSDGFEYALGQSVGFGITSVLGALLAPKFASSFLTKKILTNAATGVGMGIAGDLVFPGLLQAPKYQSDNKSLPTHYEGQKLTFELILGMGIDKVPGIAKAGFSRLNQWADSAEPFIEKGISSLNRAWGRGYSTEPIPVEGFLEESARKATSSFGGFIQGITQSTAALANNATNIYQHYFASNTNSGVAGDSPTLALPGGSQTTFTKEQVARYRGTNIQRSQVQENYLAEAYGGNTGVRQSTPIGTRVQDVGDIRLQDGSLMTIEGKNYLRRLWNKTTNSAIVNQVPSTQFIRNQAFKDVLWRREGARIGENRIIQWDFSAAPPSPELRDFLLKKRINVVE